MIQFYSNLSKNPMKTPEKKIVKTTEKKRLKDTNFDIKIADLLKKVGKTDTVHFQNKRSDQLKNLNDEGISGTISLQSLNDNAVYTTLDQVNCSIKDICDTCQNEYTRKVHGEWYPAKFVDAEELAEMQEKKLEDDEELFAMEPQGDIINIENMVVQAISLQEPFVKRCPDCEKKYQETDDENLDDYENISSFSSKSNINFS